MILKQTLFRKRNEKISFHIDGDKTSLMIGKRGQTLYSLETLVQLVFNRYSDQYHHITIDIGDYRKKRQEALEQYAIKTANRVLKTKRKVHLEPMPSNERKVVHDTIAHFLKNWPRHLKIRAPSVMLWCFIKNSRKAKIQQSWILVFFIEKLPFNSRFLLYF